MAIDMTSDPQVQRFASSLVDALDLSTYTVCALWLVRLGGWRGMAVLRIALALILGATFIVGALPKIRHPRQFAVAVLEYRLLPPNLGRLIARVLPRLELFTALLLLTGTSPRLAATLAALLLGSFILGVVVNLRRGRAIDCGCFGTRRRPISWVVVAQDGVLLLAALTMFVREPSWIAPSAWSPLQYVSQPPNPLAAPLLTCLTIAIVGSSLLNAGTWHRISPANRRSSV